jgi:protein-L-isoaspartate(D-aspartate) O-methyltransferase
LQIPKEHFVPISYKELAYSDENLEIRSGTIGRRARYMISAMFLAKMIQALNLESDDVVLDVACGMGYSTAIMAQLASSVIGLDDDEALVQKASEALQFANVPNAVIVEGDVTKGLPKEGPFDAILIAGSVDKVPDELLEQLNDNGRFITVIGQGTSAMATLFMKKNGVISHRKLFNAALPSLQAFDVKPEFVF